MPLVRCFVTGCLALFFGRKVTLVLCGAFFRSKNERA